MVYLFALTGLIGLASGASTAPTGKRLLGCAPNLGRTYDSLSKVAFAITGTKWNGPRFFGLRDKEDRPTTEARS